jgi:hypothetical protein
VNAAIGSFTSALVTAKLDAPAAAADDDGEGFHPLDLKRIQLQEVLRLRTVSTNAAPVP